MKETIANGLRKTGKFGKIALLALTMTSTVFFGAAVQPSCTANRVVQVLGVCGNGDAIVEGNRRHARSRLISFQPDGFAGMVIEGVEGLRIDALQPTNVAFEAPATAGTSTFVLRIKTQSGKIQNFLISSDSTTSLPNLSPIPIPGGSAREFQVIATPSELVGGKSNLTSDDIVAKYSFLFSSNTTGSKAEQFIEGLFYGVAPVSLLLEPLTCNLR
ncbi:MAG TPA: hypothetical protein V6C89_20195 [Drouetiella sp.]|jgi:hypothetical protein